MKKNVFSAEEIRKSRIGGEIIIKPEKIASLMKANVIIFSYNRPKMLREAIRSVLVSSYQNFDIYIMDDGSDFEVWDVIKEFSDKRILLAQIPKCSLEERVDPNSSRWPDSLNSILGQLPPEEFVVYLCDDDILGPQWLLHAAFAYDQWPEKHVIQGKTFYFYEGDDPIKTGKEGFESLNIPKKTWEEGVFWWNCGSFAVKTECFKDCAVFWEVPDGMAHSWDIKYLDRLVKHHIQLIGVPLPAVYRREHENNVSVKLGRRKEGKYGIPTRELTPELVEGMME